MRRRGRARPRPGRRSCRPRQPPRESLRRAEPRALRSVEDGHSLELGQALDREASILGARGEQDGARCDLSVVLEPDEMPSVAWFEREGAVGGCRARVELARLGDRPAGELGPADPGGKAQVFSMRREDPAWPPSAVLSMTRVSSPSEAP